MFFFFNDTATTEIYTLSLHDALPISPGVGGSRAAPRAPRASRRARAPAPARTPSPPPPRGSAPPPATGPRAAARGRADRKSTRLNSSHANISYAVFCLKKKNKEKAVQ